MVSIIAVAATGATLWISKLQDIGWSKPHATEIVWQCKNQGAEEQNKSKSVERCIIAAGAIGCNETSCGANPYKNSMFGAQKAFKTEKESIEYFVNRYYKFYFKWKDASFFYSNKPGVKPRSHYCTSEYQPNGKHLNYCKNGHKNMTHFVKKLEK